MKTTTRLKSTMAILLAIVTLSAFASPPDLLQTLHRNQIDWDRYTLKGDIASLERLLIFTHTADFRTTDELNKAGGPRIRTLSQSIQDLRAALKYLKIIHNSSKITSVKRSGGKANVRLIVSMTALIPKNKSPDGHSYEGRDIQTLDTIWVVDGGRWKIKASKTITDDFVKIRRG